MLIIENSSKLVKNVPDALGERLLKKFSKDYTKAPKEAPKKATKAKE